MLSIRYADAPTAITSIGLAFGFEAHLVVADADGGIAHAQLVNGRAVVMIGSARDDAVGPLQRPLLDRTGPVSQRLYMIVADVGSHCGRARAAGGQMVSEPQTQPYGGWLYSC